MKGEGAISSPRQHELAMTESSSVCLCRASTVLYRSPNPNTPLGSHVVTTHRLACTPRVGRISASRHPHIPAEGQTETHPRVMSCHLF